MGKWAKIRGPEQSGRPSHVNVGSSFMFLGKEDGDFGRMSRMRGGRAFSDFVVSV